MITLKLQAMDFELTLLPHKFKSDQSLYQAEHFRPKSCCLISTKRSNSQWTSVKIFMFFLSQYSQVNFYNHRANKKNDFDYLPPPMIPFQPPLVLYVETSWKAQLYRTEDHPPDPPCRGRPRLAEAMTTYCSQLFRSFRRSRSCGF